LTSRPSDTPSERAGDLGVIESRARRAAAELYRDRRWSPEDDAALDAAFSKASEGALSVPSLAERAIVARRVASHVVPRRFRPALGRLARRVDARVRRFVMARS
jgi:hypothetical protein